ncbi:DUF58 domain-containing protein [Dictyobacter arantiisoli]|uniref:DUF58 domain-containing protein n=1 Tax=Dictyobacter arantiisoli TaxID=2014874 RepID=A0A5A5TA78_9CHLR|nr:DUF58 domain-containing protein [Dictyobacter arantiisoli]GCF07879.1 hypothetical protein KDI_14430 [Dictyobacter arantiisoli]
MRPWQVFLLIMVLAFFAVSNGWKVFYVLTYVLLVLFILSWVWTRLSLRKLQFRRTATSGRVQVGETFDERLILDNVSSFPKLWVQVADGSTLPGHWAGYVASIGGWKRAMWRAKSISQQRGCFQLGPVVATSGDPFGLFRRQITLAQAQEIVVLPRVYPLSRFGLLSGGLPGRGRSSMRALQTTSTPTTIREYVTGDALSRIHWRSSAHYNKLMVKEFDLDPAIDVWLFLDLQASAQAGEGAHSTEEYGVTIAASLAAYFLQQDFSLGMIVNGYKRELLSLDRGERQIERVLELLAVVTSGSGYGLSEALAMDSFHFGRNAVAVVITASNSQSWHESVRQLQLRGVQIVVIALDAPSFEGQPLLEDTFALLEGANIPVLRIKHGDSIVQILETGSQVRSTTQR